MQGCSIEQLGVLRYRPAAAPAFAERWRRGRGHDWERMPVVVFNEKDDLQHDLLRGRGVDQPAVVHRVPTSADFHEAVRLGLGWATIPEPQLDPDLASGRWCCSNARERVDVPPLLAAVAAGLARCSPASPTQSTSRQER